MHLKSRSGGGRQDTGRFNLNALPEEGLPFWRRALAAVGGVKRLEMKEGV